MKKERAVTELVEIARHMEELRGWVTPERSPFTAESLDRRWHVLIERLDGEALSKAERRHLLENIPLNPEDQYYADSLCQLLSRDRSFPFPEMWRSMPFTDCVADLKLSSFHASMVREGSTGCKFSSQKELLYRLEDLGIFLEDVDRFDKFDIDNALVLGAALPPGKIDYPEEYERRLIARINRSGYSLSGYYAGRKHFEAYTDKHELPVLGQYFRVEHEVLPRREPDRMERIVGDISTVSVGEIVRLKNPEAKGGPFPLGKWTVVSLSECYRNGEILILIANRDASYRETHMTVTIDEVEVVDH